MSTESKLKIQLLLNATHEGEVCSITQDNVVDAVRGGIDYLIREETDDEEIEVKISIYVSEFEYADNLDSMRNIIHESLTTLDSESLTQLLEIINNG